MSFVAACNMLFGYRAGAFSNIPQSASTCLQMIFGEYFYTIMFKADSEVSAFIFVVFVYIFTFVTINMYIAIVMRTYVKLREQKMYLSQAMARLFWNQTKTNLLNIFNLLFCRNTEPRDRGRLNNRQAMAIEPTFTEICRKNWYECTKSKIVTK